MDFDLPALLAQRAGEGYELQDRYVTGKPRILYCDHAFHGLTLGSLSVNGSAEFRRGFDPLLPDGRIPLGDLDALARELRRGDVAGLLVEPIQGKGVHVSPPGFL